MANASTALRFKAMERSLRAVGCELPLWVIPYDDNKFDLPENATWWEIPELIAWLKDNACRGVYRKYQCLLTANYQFVDADVVFLRNPSEVLFKEIGFIPSCGHWHNPGQTYSAESLIYLKKKSTTWQKSIFNTGQFACSIALYTFEQLKQIASSDEFAPTCLNFKPHEQPGINQLVNASGVSIRNLTLGIMQSTWAGDYTDENYRAYWKTEEETPYLIHWAGSRMDVNRPIDELFLKHLTAEEKIKWFELVHEEASKRNTFYKRLRRYLSSIKLAVKSINF